MSTWYIGLGVIVMLIVGFIKQFFAIRSHIGQHELVSEFLGKFIDWCNGRGQDYSLYNWLIKKSETVQVALGQTGLMNVRKPFENRYHADMPIILNFIPEIHNEFSNDPTYRGSISQSNLSFSIQSVDGCLRRFLGTKATVIGNEQKRLWNPFVWFGGGIRWLLEIPLILLSESGGLSNRRRTAIVKGRIFSFFSGSVSLAAFVGTVMSIILGWDKCVEIVKDWLK